MAKEKTASRGSSRRTRIDLLSPMPPEFVPPLIAFASYIASLDVDYIIFMARKAVRLHDLLVSAGCEIPKAQILTSSILDQSLAPLLGKRVAIVDDTLILGTTFAEAERTLTAAGVRSIYKVVFAIDEDNRCRDLTDIDKNFVGLSESQMLTFCANEVESLAIGAVPYIADFPMSRKIRVARSNIERVFSLPGWDSFSLSSARQEAAGVFYYTHVPDVGALPGLADALGELSKIVDIVKVRTFVLGSSGGYLIRVVPIITLHPLSEDRIEVLFSILVDFLNQSDPSAENRLTENLQSAKSKLRLLQYFISLLIGRGFLSSLADATGQRRPMSFDLEEAARLFGPWLRGDIDLLHTIADQLMAGGRDAPEFSSKVDHDALPAPVRALIRKDLTTFALSRTGGDGNTRRLFYDLLQVFVQLHVQYELPARREVRQLGRRALDAGLDEAPHRNRLKVGFAWTSLVKDLLARHQLNARADRPILLSLMLDVLIDIGIAVPILCQHEGVLFRAYRHGEPVPLERQEAAIIYELVDGFLQSSGRADVPRLTMEKLLVAIYRVGGANGFLRNPLYGLDGTQRVARIAFHRHGAVMTYTDQPALYADGQDSYLSRYLVETGVLSRTPGGHYSLGKRPDAALLDGSALFQSRQFGSLMGRLVRRPGSGSPVVLDEDDLVVLATCILPRDAAAAVLAELRLFLHWFDAQRDSLQVLDFSVDRDWKSLYQGFSQGDGGFSLNSAKLKLLGYKELLPGKLVQRGTEALQSRGDDGSFLAGHWAAIWAPVLAGATVEQHETFDRHILELAREVLGLSTGYLMMEWAIAIKLGHDGSNNVLRLNRVRKKIITYFNGFDKISLPSPSNERMVRRVRALCAAPTSKTNPQAIFAEGFEHLTLKCPAARVLGSSLTKKVRNYGPLRPRTEFQYLLWYDMVNSLGERGNIPAVDMERYRQNVRSFKESINSTLFGIKRDAIREGVFITYDGNNLESLDDGRNILFGKTGASRWLRETVGILLRESNLRSVALRMLAINADFAGYSPYSYHDSPDVLGEAFWEYGSRVKGWIKDNELRLAPDLVSTLWLGGDLRNEIEHFPNVRPIGNPIIETVPTTVGGRLLRTRVSGWRVEP